ncbi:ADP-ribosylation factor GTPase-activating protein 2 [Pseudoliparis swirei]|uniref:ADP-ribosylation factor GTPase-activating protein 2 n=1 Tax=Pseudoliparis swirei TaxID=2059687 RepID=UPI0024BE0573|nr:ADP-ribosylation factor GTPase-activating protein 2 [Pseudoliparis swirei]
MATEPNKTEILSIFKRLRSVATNKACFDCVAKSPSWASISHGVFLCIDCSGVHRSLGVHLSFIRSTELDSNWNWFQLRCMQVGGNSNATVFFRQHGCSTGDTTAKYNSCAAQLYREKVRQQANAALSKYGSDLWIESSAESAPPAAERKEADFFDELTTQTVDGWSAATQQNGAAVTSQLSGPGDAHVKPSIIGKKKPMTTRRGLGAKKGLGAQKVSNKNFSEVEKQAQLAEKMREDRVAESKKQADESIVASMRLAYKELEIDRKMEEKKIQSLEGKKREQAERLGMGFGNRSAMSHSVMSEMQVIEQETPVGVKSSSSRSKLDMFEEPGFSSGPPKYKDNPFTVGDSFGSRWDTEGGAASFSTSWALEKEEPKEEVTISTIQPIGERLPSRRKADVAAAAAESLEARQKFANAKAISSDMFFGRESSAEYDAKSRLETMSGSTSISSADLFGEGRDLKGRAPGFDSVLPAGPDIAQFKQGVKTVAGKMAVLANGVMNTIQDRYGSY